jgi:hypothetical protein
LYLRLCCCGPWLVIDIWLYTKSIDCIRDRWVLWLKVITCYFAIGVHGVGATAPATLQHGRPVTNENYVRSTSLIDLTESLLSSFGGRSKKINRETGITTFLSSTLRHFPPGDKFDLFFSAAIEYILFCLKECSMVGKSESWIYSLSTLPR